MQDAFVQVNGLRLHDVDRSGAGRPLRLVHGAGLVARIRDELAPAFASVCHPIAIDRRGHGDSDMPVSGYQLRDFAADVVGFCAALGLDEIDAVGHSSGGSLLTLVATLRRGLLRRAVLIDPIIFGPREDALGGHLNGLIARISARRDRWPSRAEMFAAPRRRPPHDAWTATTLQAFVDHGARELPDGTVELKCRPAVEAEMCRHDPAQDLFQSFAAAPAALRIIRAAASDRFPAASGERGGDTGSDCRLVTQPGVSRFAPMEQPRAVALLALALLGGDEPEPAP